MMIKNVLTGLVILSLTLTSVGFSSDNSTLTEAECKHEYTVCVKTCRNKYNPSKASTEKEKEDLKINLKGCLFRCSLEEKSCLAKIEAKNFFHITKEWFKGFLQH